MQFTLQNPAALKYFTRTSRPPLDNPTYGTDQLQQFERFNRGDFLTKTGQWAPAHRSEDEAGVLGLALGIPAEEAELFTRIKRWADLNALDDAGDYEIRYVVAVGGMAVWHTMTITNRLARSINLPGQYEYQKWVPAASGVTVVGPDGPTGTVSETYLVTPEQAEALAAAIGGTAREDAFGGGIFHYQFAQNERRRVFYVMVGNRPYVAGELLRQQYQKGIDAPGSWGISAIGTPLWTPLVDPDVGEHDLRPEIPIPCRALYPQERFQTSGFGGLLQIGNLGLIEETEIEIVRRIDRNVKAIQEKLTASSPGGPPALP